MPYICPICRPLHEHGVREVTDATLSGLRMTTTTVMPPSVFDSVYSPLRILWIIVGTLVVFFVGLMGIKAAFVQYRHWEDTSRFVRLRCKALYACAEYSYKCISQPYLEARHYFNRGAYDLSASADDDFYNSSHGSGALSSHYVDDGLNIHYSRRKGDYLDDDEEEDARHSPLGGAALVGGEIELFPLTLVPTRHGSPDNTQYHSVGGVSLLSGRSSDGSYLSAFHSASHSGGGLSDVGAHGGANSANGSGVTSSSPLMVSDRGDGSEVHSPLIGGSNS